MSEIIQESCNFTLRGSNVKCEYSHAGNLWPVNVDEGQMSQVIHNLILNADQSMPEGGEIVIECENVMIHTDAGLPLAEGRYVKIVVKDRGTGIAEEHRQKIFDPYFTTKEMGRGLGLAITYSIIKNHGGHIKVESQLGAGTKFILYIPASEKQFEKEAHTKETLCTGQGKILIMDDEEMVRNALGEMLSYIGYDVEYAKDGAEAIEIYRNCEKSSDPFDLVILDLTIPGGMGGKSAVKTLLEINPKVKAIVSSGYSKDPVMAKYREYGFCDVIIKPFKSPEELSMTLNRVINKSL
jgi:CheY-like chemotaxis protein